MPYAECTDFDAVAIICDLRAAGMTVPAIARHVGVTTDAVNRWIARTRNPTPYAVKRLRELHTHLTGWERTPPAASATA